LCACKGEIILANGKNREQCLYFDKPKCLAFEKLSKAGKEKILKKRKRKYKDTRMVIAERGEGLSGGCEDCYGEGIIDNFAGGILVGDQEYY